MYTSEMGQHTLLTRLFTHKFGLQALTPAHQQRLQSATVDQLDHFDDWYIGWLVDIPGVNAQEKTYDEVLKSLQIGAEEMLSMPIEFDENAQMVYVTIPEMQHSGSSRQPCS